jgi:hypothetical protein
MSPAAILIIFSIFFSVFQAEFSKRLAPDIMIPCLLYPTYVPSPSQPFIVHCHYSTKWCMNTPTFLLLCNALITRLLHPLPIFPHASELRDLRFDSECVIVAGTSLFIIVQMSSFPYFTCHWLRISLYWHLKPRKRNVTRTYVAFLFSFWSVIIKVCRQLITSSSVIMISWFWVMVLTACKSNHFGLVSTEFTSFHSGSRSTPAYILIVVTVVLAYGNGKSMKMRER